jgi:hypothetical protein
MRPGLRAIVETEDAFNFAIQFIGQMNRSCSPSVRPTFVFKTFEVYVKRPIELGNCARQDHAPPGRVFLHHSQAMGCSEFLNLPNVTGLSPEMLCKFFTLQMLWSATGFIEILDPGAKFIVGPSPQ